MGQAVEVQAGGNVGPQGSEALGCQSPGQHQAKAGKADSRPDGSLYSECGDSPPPLPPSSQAFDLGIAFPPTREPGTQKTLAGRDRLGTGVVDLNHPSTSLNNDSCSQVILFGSRLP